MATTDSTDTFLRFSAVERYIKYNDFAGSSVLRPAAATLLLVAVDLTLARYYGAMQVICETASQLNFRVVDRANQRLWRP